MSNLTIALADDLLRRARIRALEQGTSVNAVLRVYLEQYVGGGSSQSSAAKRFLALASASTARRGAARWTRDDLHER